MGRASSPTPTRSFDHPDVVPLRRLEDGPRTWPSCSEGPTLAFKDVALQLVGRLFDHELTRRGERVTVVGATSGDTGSAAIEALPRRAPRSTRDPAPPGPGLGGAAPPDDHGARRQHLEPGRRGHVRRLPGPGEGHVRRRAVPRRMRLSAVNSINWARVMAQIVYYVTTAAALGASAAAPGHVRRAHRQLRQRLRRPRRPAAMGLPVRRLVVASNRNDILTRFFATGTMRAEPVVPTLSPSMDIQVSSNFERLLFEVLGRDGAAVGRAAGPLPGRGRGGASTTAASACSPRGSRRTGPTTRRPWPRSAPCTSATASSSTPTPRSASAGGAATSPATGAGGRPGHRAPGQVPRRRRGGPPACARRCPTASPTCSTGPSGSSAVPNDLAAVETSAS